MKLETFKSFLLVVLIGLSLLLTFGIWNYKTEYEQYDQQQLSREVDVGGSEVTKNQIIEPKSIIFHAGEQHLGYENPRENGNFFQEMQSWTFTDLTLTDGESPEGYDVELTLPDALPIRIINDPLFSFTNQVEITDNWSFDKIYLTLNPDNSTITIQFLSVDERNQATAQLTNSIVYDQITELLASRQGLTEYVEFEGGAQPIYVRSNTDNVTRRTIAVSHISPDEFVRELFPDEQVVNPQNTPNLNLGKYYNDGTREISISPNERLMNFYNPNASDIGITSIGALTLLQNSIDEVNSHKGWTGQLLSEINSASNEITFRLHYAGLPVYSPNDYSIMKLQFQGQDLIRYNRGLLRLDNEIQNDKSTSLPSGEEVIYHLKNETNDINIENVEDIQLGYDLYYQDDRTVILEPEWFMEINGAWQQIQFEDVPNAQQEEA
ncbi:YycH family regulatory protein [Virgibacillus salexigens]|uniref:Two-component system YycF/YycG regulatory protein YycH n=1 Tax=Virgibacillus massiliensis TaxID=1462526 RepID=A0A024Q6G2_9BACI|nr:MULTISPECIES: two-component system activity regulator YycH [Virgibacillus]CDQ37882.1 Two-component system YycF/YycG regulatory protein YycH [Virgibacillus massiliensis]